MKSVSNLWQTVTDQVKSSVTEQTYATWFEPITPVSVDESSLVIQVPSQFYYEWIDSHYRQLILSGIKNAIDRDLQIKYRIELGGNESNEKKIKPDEKPLLFIPPNYNKKAQLNNRYTFDFFVEGENNQLAKAATMSVAESPGQTSFNPLLIYGGVGLGKTHLLQAIGNYVIQKNQITNIYYTTSERFTLDFISSIQNNKTAEFSAKCRNVDVLLVDDIQFLQKKEQTQEQFFHTFNELYQQGKQVVLTSDRHPSELYGLKDRLISRFQSGLMVDIQPPNLETRIAILQKKAEEDGLDISYDILEFIATNVRNNIREMEGALIKLLAHSSLSHTDVTMELARQALQETLGKSLQSGITINDIIKSVSSYLNVSENRLIGKGRKKEIALARQIAMYLSREMVGSSLENIGLHFGGRDHTTVIHACRTVEKKIEEKQEFARQVHTIRNRMIN
tara:strand:+ start:22450 stop:23799 length:1350 start_codon:yes stop_codon:yes gene_type:complete